MASLSPPACEVTSWFGRRDAVLLHSVFSVSGQKEVRLYSSSVQAKWTTVRLEVWSRDMQMSEFKLRSLGS